MLKGLQHPNIVRFYDFWEVKKQDDTKKSTQSSIQDHTMRLKGNGIKYEIRMTSVFFQAVYSLCYYV